MLEEVLPSLGCHRAGFHGWHETLHVGVNCCWGRYCRKEAVWEPWVGSNRRKKQQTASKNCHFRNVRFLVWLLHWRSGGRSLVVLCYSLLIKDHFFLVLFYHLSPMLHFILWFLLPHFISLFYSFHRAWGRGKGLVVISSPISPWL